MNKLVIGKTAARTAARHPRATVRVLGFGARHRKGLLETVRTGRKAQRVSGNLVARATDQRFRQELGSAAAALGGAVTRARSVGTRKAAGDREVSRLVREAAAHLSVALEKQQPKPRRHRARKLAVAGLAVGLAYAAAKASGTRSPRPV